MVKSEDNDYDRLQAALHEVDNLIDGEPKERVKSFIRFTFAEKSDGGGRKRNKRKRQVSPL